jgi:KaiC/GvpD/RAD55 family RecA-like ATPase
LKRFNTTTGPFDDFYKLIGGELPAPSTLLIQGEPGSGTTTLGLEMLRHQLNSGKRCGLLTYDAFPSEIRLKMKKIGLDITNYLNDGTLKIIDCYSGLVGDDHAPIRDPVDFTEISIQVTGIIEKADKGPITILLDSLTPIFNNAPAPTAINFLRVVAAKIKNRGGIFIMTGTKGSIPEEVRSKIEAGVDGVLDIGLARKGDTVTRILTIKKLAGHQFSASPSEFKIVPDKGILFKKQRLTFRRHPHLTQSMPKPSTQTPGPPGLGPV